MEEEISKSQLNKDLDEASHIIKSQKDRRNYQSITLSNQLQVLLVCDPETQKSAASLDISIGSLECSKGFKEGTAHFLEHMLFMGTQKYPNQNEYSKFLSQNSGDSNAYTDLMNTNYYFYCSNEAFFEALDRFADFFSDPLFDETCVDKEINAVENEFQMSLNSDAERIFQIIRHNSSKKSPFNGFTCGNKQTLLSPTIRQEMIDFYNKFYSSNLMNLVVYSEKSLDQLQDIVTKLFNRVPNKQLPQPLYSDFPFTIEDFQSQLFKIIPIQEQDTLIMYWVFDYLDSDYRLQYYQYITHLLGHEGQNSVYCSLIKQGLATQITAFVDNYMDRFSIIGVEIGLTEEGFDKHDEVIQLVCQYINFLKGTGIQKWVWQEIKQVDEITFNFKQKQELEVFTTAVSARMKYVRTEDVLRAPYIMGEFNPEQIQKLLQRMKIQNLTILLSSQTFDPSAQNEEGQQLENGNSEQAGQEQIEEDEDSMTPEPNSVDPDIANNNNLSRGQLEAETEFLVEPHFGTKYQVQEYPEYIQNSLASLEGQKESKKKGSKRGKKSDVIGYPPQNQYIPEDFRIKSLATENLSTTTYPQKIAETDFSQIWFKQDSNFRVAKGIIHVHIYTEKQLEHFQPKQAVLITLWQQVFNNYISKKRYLADMAHFKTEIKIFEKGVEIKIKGFNDKLPNYFYDVFNHLINFPYQQEIKENFELFYEKVEIEWSNFYKEAVEEIVEDFVDVLQYHQGQTTMDSKFQALKQIQQKDLIQFSHSWLKKLRLEWVVVGNFYQDQVIQLNKSIENLLLAKQKQPLPKSQYPQVRINKLTLKSIYKYQFLLSKEHPDEPNSALNVSFFGPLLDPKSRILYRIFTNHIQEPFFDQLRTNQQLGYSVFAFSEILRGVMKFMFAIVSSNSDPNHISKRVNEFLKQFWETQVEPMNEEKFNKLKQSTLLTITEKDQKLNQEADRLINEVYTRQFMFDRKETAPKIMEQICLNYYKQEFYSLFFSSACRMQVHVVSKIHEESQSKNSSENLSGYDNYIQLDNQLAIRELCSKSKSVHNDYYNK